MERGLREGSGVGCARLQAMDVSRRNVRRAVPVRLLSYGGRVHAGYKRPSKKERVRGASRRCRACGRHNGSAWYWVGARASGREPGSGLLVPTTLLAAWGGRVFSRSPAEAA